MRDEDRETLIMVMMATTVAVVGLVGLLVAFFRGNGRNVCKTYEPPESFVVDKTARCLSGIRESFSVGIISIDSNIGDDLKSDNMKYYSHLQQDKTGFSPF